MNNTYSIGSGLLSTHIATVYQVLFIFCDLQFTHTHTVYQLVVHSYMNPSNQYYITVLHIVVWLWEKHGNARWLEKSQICVYKYKLGAEVSFLHRDST